MVDYSTYSILTKCAELDDSGFLPIYEAYFSPMQEDPARIVYITNNVNRKFVSLLCKIFIDEEFNLVICTDSEYKSSDHRVTIHKMDYGAPTSSLLGKINAYGPIDVVINDSAIDFPDQVTVMKLSFRYLVPGGYYILKADEQTENLKKIISYTKMLKKSALDIDWVRSYNSETFNIIRKLK